MKNLVIIAVIFFTVNFSFAQNAVFNGTGEDIRSGRESGIFEFTLPETVDEEEVNKSASYYTSYFIVDYNHESRVAKISMQDNDEMGRRVINRFMLSSGVRHIEVEGKEYSLSDFFNTFMR